MRERRRDADRRGRRYRFIFFDRRTGFDRRYDGGSLLATLRDHEEWIVLLLLAINLLNLLDLSLTWRALHAGAREANPILALLLTRDPMLGAYFKVSIIVTMSLVFWLFRTYKTVLCMLIVCAGVFTGVALYHAALQISLIA